MKEYDSFNILDTYVLTLLSKNKKLFDKEIFEQTNKKVPVTESTINSCLILLYLDNLIAFKHLNGKKLLKITQEGKNHLAKYQQARKAMLELYR